ncbi:MAG: DUF2079 domain-containing protein [Trebonia sp.]
MLGERPVRATAVDAADEAAPGRPVTTPWRDPVVWGIATISFGAYFAISLFKLLRLTPSTYDLGIFTEFVKQLSQLHAPTVDMLHAGLNLEGDHFQIAVGVLAPFFRIFPTPATLLFFQALLTAVSVFPVAGAARALTGRSTGRLIAFAYAFSWGLQQMNEFEFHEIALAVPLLAFCLSALVRRRPMAAIGWAMPLVFVKENQGFTLAAIGGLLMVSAAFPAVLPGGAPAPASAPPADGGRGGRRPRDYHQVALWGGVFLVCWGLFWSTLAITVIIPHFNPLHAYRFWNMAGGDLGSGKQFSVGALLVQAGGGWPVKGPTLVLLLLPTAFVALGSPVVLLVLPDVALRFISTDPSYWGTAWHYNATVMPILFIAAAEALGRWRRAHALAWPPPGGGGRARELLHAAQVAAVRHGGAVMAAVTVALCFQFPVSGLWRASTYRLDAHVAAADAAMAVVPDGATVLTNLDLLAPLAARTDTFWFGAKGNPLTEYIVFDGDDSGYSPPVTNVPRLIATWYKNDGYVQVFARDNVYVYRRG